MAYQGMFIQPDAASGLPQSLATLRSSVEAMPMTLLGEVKHERRVSEGAMGHGTSQWPPTRRSPYDALRIYSTRTLFRSSSARTAHIKEWRALTRNITITYPVRFGAWCS